MEISPENISFKKMADFNDKNFENDGYKN